MNRRTCHLLAVMALCIGFAAGCEIDVDTDPMDVEFFPAGGDEMRALPFSEAVRVGRTLYLSGQIGTVAGKVELAPGGIGPETRQTLDNIEAVLARAGAGLSDVVKCTVFLADIAEWPAMNEVYVQYFESPYPARSAVAGSGLALDARVEIECIAVLPE